MQAGTQEVLLKCEMKLLHGEVTEHWNRLPRGLWCPSAETFKTHMDAFLCDLIWVFLLQQGDWTR